MAYGENTTYITYRVLRGTAPVDLELTPLITYRDFHTLSSGQGWWRRLLDARPFWLLANRGSFTPSGIWYWDFHHRAERERGLDDRSDLFAAGTFAASLSLGDSLTLVLTTEG